MKKGLISMLAVCSIAVVATCSCGDKFVPLTQDQMNAKADSIFNAQKDAKVAQLKASCDSSSVAEASVKFENMKNAATASK